MTHFKLGLFTLLGLAALVTTALGLGLDRKHDVVTYHTYFDESVQGLDVGATVRYRGVLIGTVSEVRVAPDNRHIDAILSLEGKEARRLGLARPRSDLRTQLGTQGITGVKYVDIDFFDPKNYPVEALPFQVAEHVIPSAPSSLKTMIDAALAALRELESILNDVGGQQIPARIAKLLDGADATVSDVRGLLARVDQSKLPEKTTAAIENLDGAIKRANGVLDSLGGDGGLVASAHHATDNLGDLGHTTTASMRELERTLRDIDEAAQAVRELATAIDRDPDMLIKGHAREHEP